MRRFAAPVLVVFMLAGCAGTTLSRAQTASVLVKEAGKAMLSACRESQAKSWAPPLTHQVCYDISIAYEGAWEASKVAVKLIRQGAGLDIKTATEIGKFLFDVAKLLKDAGLELPFGLRGYIDTAARQAVGGG